MNKTRITILICVLLALLTLGAFWRVLGCGFVDFDDDVYVTANRWVQSGLTGGSIKWALTAAYESTWQPMVWLSYMADYEVYGLNPFGYHLTNLLLHIASVLLLFLILGRMTAGAGAFSGLSHVGYLVGFYTFYHFSHALDDNFYAVLAAGITILSLESYHIWTWCQERIRHEKQYIVRLDRMREWKKG